MRGLVTNTIQKIKKEPDQFLLMVLLLVLPFERIPSLTVGGITLRMSLVVGCVIILRAAYLVYKKRTNFYKITPYKILAIFLLWLVLIIPESINLKRAVMVVAYDTYAIVLCVSITLLYKKKYLQPMLVSLFVGATIVSIFGLYQYLGDIFGIPMKYTGLRVQYTRDLFGFPRIQSTGLEPLYFASYLLLPVSILVSLILTRTNLGKVRAKVLLSGLVLFSLVIFLTVSRGAMYGYLFALTCLFIYLLFKKFTNYRRVGFVALAVVIGFACSWLMIKYFNTNPAQLFTTKERGTAVYSDQITKTTINDSGDARSIARRDAIEILQKEKVAIVIGIGPGQFGPYVTKNVPDAEGGWIIVNNQTLEMLVEFGIVGLALFVWFVGYLVVSALRALPLKDKLSHATLIGLLGYMLAEAVQYQTFSTLYVTHIWVAFALMLAILIEQGAIRQKTVKKNS